MTKQINSKLHALPPLTNRGVICAAKQPNQTPKNPTCIVFDWMQASCKFTQTKSEGKLLDFNICMSGAFLFTSVLTDKRSKNFKYIYEVKTIFNGAEETFATVQCCPYVSFIPMETAIIKIENKFLYTKELAHLFNCFLSEFKLKFNHWSRLDFAIDFQRFDYRNLTPQNFISLYSRNVYKLKGSKRSKCMEDKITTTVKRNDNYKGLSFGSRSSGLKITLYNKSEEMRQIKNKPYIKETWLLNGIDENTSDVWRLEFSLQKDSLTSFEIDKTTGEVFKQLSFTDINLIELNNWQEFFKSAYNKSFQWAIKGNQTQFCRMKKIDLFNFTTNFILEKVSDKKVSDKMTKHRIKHMVKLMENYEDSTQLITPCLHTVVLDLIQSYALERWFKNEFPFISMSMPNLPEMLTSEQIEYRMKINSLKTQLLF